MSASDEADPPATVSVALSADELLILNNALNEVCNGVEIDDFEFSTRIGSEREEARALLRRIGQLLDGLSGK